MQYIYSCETGLAVEHKDEVTSEDIVEDFIYPKFMYKHLVPENYPFTAGYMVPYVIKESEEDGALAATMVEGWLGLELVEAIEYVQAHR